MISFSFLETTLFQSYRSMRNVFHPVGTGALSLFDCNILFGGIDMNKLSVAFRRYDRAIENSFVRCVPEVITSIVRHIGWCRLGRELDPVSERS